jgi:predicted DNA-binding protein (UPF0251 family)
VLQGSMVRGALMPAARDASAADAQDDARLQRRLARDDARALETLYQRHTAALFGYLLALNQAELQDLVAGINELGPLHHEVLALVFVHELSYAEAAHVLEVPIGTVRSRLSVARRRLHMRRNEGRKSVHDQ